MMRTYVIWPHCTKLTVNIAWACGDSTKVRAIRGHTAKLQTVNSHTIQIPQSLHSTAKYDVCFRQEVLTCEHGLGGAVLDGEVLVCGVELALGHQDPPQPLDPGHGKLIHNLT